MGKRKNKRKNQQHQQHHHHHKRRKVERYWVEDCTELKPPPTVKPSLVVTISRVELHDDHTHQRPKVPSDTSQKKGETKLSQCGDESKSKQPAEASNGTKDSSNAKDSNTTTEDCNATTEKVASVSEKKERNELDERKPRKEEESAPEEDICIDDAFIAIQRDPSAKGPLKKFAHQNFKPLSNGDCGDGVVNPHDKKKVPDKYWAQRKRFFSRFDDGVRLDKEGWYSVTPEMIANHLAERLVERSRNKTGMVVLDAFCGCGGNAIAFARRPEVSLVLAIDSDREKLELTANNAAVYDIPKEKLVLIHGNACDALQLYKDGERTGTKASANGKNPTHELLDGFQIGGMDLMPDHIDSIFLSPPWGGMDYEASGKRNYHIETCIEVDASPETKWNGEEILQACATATKGPVLYFLPRNINGISLGRSALKSKYEALEIEQNLLNNKLKTVTAYLGM